MKIDPNAPAFPWEDRHEKAGLPGPCPGLAVRAEIAKTVMAGFAANHLLSSKNAEWAPENYAAASVKMADALIAELNKPAE